MNSIKLKLLIAIIFCTSNLTFTQEIIFKFSPQTNVDPNEINVVSYGDDYIVFTPVRIWIHNSESGEEDTLLSTDSYYNTFDYQENIIVLGEFQNDKIIPYKFVISTRIQEVIDYDISHKLLKDIQLVKNNLYLFSFWNETTALDQLSIVDRNSFETFYELENLNYKSYDGYFYISNELVIEDMRDNKPVTYFLSLDNNFKTRDTINYYKHYYLDNRTYLLSRHSGRYKLSHDGVYSDIFYMKGIHIINMSNDLSDGIYIYENSNKTIYRFDNLELLRSWLPKR